MMRPRYALVCWLLPLVGCVPDLSSLDEGEASEAGRNTAGVGATLPIASSGAGGSVTGFGGATAGSGGNPSLAGSNGSAGAPGTAGAAPQPSAGSGGGPAMCQPTGMVEGCDGVDDDCNGVVDDGCPGGVTTTYVKDLELIGDSYGGSPFTEDCNAGEVLGAVAFAVGGYVTQLKGICYSLRLKPNMNAEQGYDFELINARELGPHPSATGDQVTVLSCPAGEAVVGLRLSQQRQNFNGAEGIITPRAWLICAHLVLKKSGDALSVAWEGAKQVGPVSGSLVNENANWFVETAAMSPLVASRLRGQTGDYVDRAGVGVSEIKVVKR